MVAEPGKHGNKYFTEPSGPLELIEISSSEAGEMEAPLGYNWELMILISLGDMRKEGAD